jgi:flagellar hook-associated protein 3 FlgL
MSNVSSIGNFLTSVGLIQASELQVQQLTEENATGLQSVSLQGYGTSAPLVLNLQSSLTETQSWLSNSTEINNYLTGYTQSLNQLNSDGTQLQSALAALESGGKSALSSISTLIQGLETDVTATLNTQVGDRYIYAGNRFDTPPSVDITGLPVPTTPSAIALASGNSTPPTIPAYDTDYASGTPPGTVASGTPYYAQQTVNIADNTSVTFGVSADDPSIQQLVYALKQAEAGASATSPATAKAFFANATSAIATALSGLSDLSQQNASNATTIQTTQSVQKQSIATLQSQIGDLTQVDPATVATQLSSVENQLQGTYKATATLLNLSLINYLQ